MTKKHWLGVIVVVGVVALGLGLSGPARSQLPPAAPGPLPRELAAMTELEEKDVAKVLAALGPAIAQQIGAGRQVELPNLGTFRVVRLPQTRNLVDGRVVVERARNIVEFLPTAGLDQASNAVDAVPAATVQNFEYVPLANQTPGQRVPSNRAPSTRVR